MLRLAIAVVSVALADSANPSTIGPALYLATMPRRQRRVAEFTVGVFAINLVVGLVLTIGPGRLLVGLIPRPQKGTKHAIELAAGLILLLSSLAVWLGRRRLTRHELPMRDGDGSAFLAGASLAALELPTAVPYFAIVAAIVASSAKLPAEIGLVVLYNVVFVLPLVVIVVVLLVAGGRADPWLENAGAWLQRRWPVVLASMLLLVGSALTVVGGTGLVKQ
jgi:cytochrome c biogenesis protein CcdA